MTQDREAARLRQALDKIKTPSVRIPQISRAEDVDLAAKAIAQFVDFHKTRERAIRDLRAALTSLIERGAEFEFEFDAAMWSEHLFRMSVIVGLLVKAKVQDEKFPEAGRPKRLAAATEEQAKSAAGVHAIVEKAKTEVTALDKLIGEVESAGESATKQLAGLKQSQEATLADLRWGEGLRAKDAAAVLAAYETTRTDLV